MNPVIGVLLILASSIGHAEWWIQLVNRSHAFRIDFRKLRLVRRVHDIAVVCFPPALTGSIGFGPRGLLYGGTWSDQSSFIQGLLLLTSLGLVPLLAATVRWQRSHRKLFHSADTAETFDLQQLSQRDSGLGDVAGPRPSFLRTIPQNQILQLEINTKTIRPRRTARSVPDAAAPLRIVHFTDLHFIGCPGEGYYRWALGRAAGFRPDAFVFTGDLIDDPSLIPLAMDCLESLVSIAPCFFILGNHDWRHDHQSLRRSLSELGWLDLAGRSVVQQLGGRQVLLAGSERPWMGQQAPAVHDTSCNLKILLSHSPDQLRFAVNAGYDLMLSGHTHGGQVVLPLIGPVYSPSVYGVKYASGLFSVNNLSLHVSRGMGAKDGLRWRCTPELTCLHIYS